MYNQPEDQWLEARLRDAMRQSAHRPCFVGFLDEREAALARRLVRSEGFVNGCFWGGYEDSERVMFGAFPDYLEPDPALFPLQAITLRFRPCDSLNHRDFLGAFLGAGLQRNTLGDILPEEGRCVCFAREEAAAFLLSQITRIGRVGVKLQPGFAEPLPQGKGFAPFQGVIASPRLDCVVAAATGQSREKASRMVAAGLVMKNHEPLESPSASVEEGDVLSIRGKGRYLIDRLGPVTKKGRLSIAGRKCL